MRQTIVSNQQKTGDTPKPKKWRNRMLISIGLLLIFGLAAFLLKLPLIFFAPFAFLALYFRSLWIKDKGHFHAYIDGPVLYLDFRDTQEAGNTLSSKAQNRNCHLEILLNTIQGYRLHSFLGKAPELMQIQMRVQQQLIETRPIPIYYLDKEQQQLFLNFLDALIVKTKRLRTG